MEEPIVVEIDEDLADLIPGYLENRRKDIESILHLLQEGNFSEIRRIGHSMKGSGGGYGFHHISVIGQEIEKAAEAGDENGIRTAVNNLKNYLDRVKIVYI